MTDAPGALHCWERPLAKDRAITYYTHTEEELLREEGIINRCFQLS